MSVVALKKRSINIDLITNNLSTIFALFLTTFKKLFGLGSRVLIQKFLFDYYSKKKNLQVSSFVKTEIFEGVIESINNIATEIKEKIYNYNS